VAYLPAVCPIGAVSLQIELADHVLPLCAFMGKPAAFTLPTHAMDVVPRTCQTISQISTCI